MSSILPKVHFESRSWVVMNLDQTKFIDSGLKKLQLKKKYPLNPIVDGSYANKLMGLDDRGYPIV